MTNKEYTRIYGDKCLDDVIDGFVDGCYTWQQVKQYMSWNDFSIYDIDVGSIFMQKSLKNYKKRGVK